MMIPVHCSCVIKLQGAQKILIGYEINHSCGFNLLATSWEIDGETVETVSDFILGGSKITADGDCSHEIKRRLLLGRKVMKHIEKQRHYFANKGPSSQGYGFSSGHVWM